MNDMYVVIHFSEDGDPPIIKRMSGDEIKKHLKDEYWGSRPKFVQPGQEINTDFMGNAIMIIKGEIMVPKAVQVATEWEL